MVYECIFGDTPWWPVTSAFDLLDKQDKKKVITFPDSPEISDALKNVLIKMCYVDKELRCTIE